MTVRDQWHQEDPQLIAEVLFAVTSMLSFTRLAYILPAQESLGTLQISIGKMIDDMMRCRPHGTKTVHKTIGADSRSHTNWNGCQSDPGFLLIISGCQVAHQLERLPGRSRFPPRYVQSYSCKVPFIPVIIDPMQWYRSYIAELIVFVFVFRFMFILMIIGTAFLCGLNNIYVPYVISPRLGK